MLRPAGKPKHSQIVKRLRGQESRSSYRVPTERDAADWASANSFKA